MACGCPLGFIYILRIVTFREMFMSLFFRILENTGNDSSEYSCSYFPLKRSLVLSALKTYKRHISNGSVIILITRSETNIDTDHFDSACMLRNVKFELFHPNSRTVFMGFMV